MTKRKFSDRIIEFMQQPDYEPMKPRKLAREMGIAEGEYGGFHDAVDALRRVGRVMVGSDNAVMLPMAGRKIVGTYRGNPRGFGFVVPQHPTAHGDLFIAEGQQNGAVTGDKVLCRVIKRKGRQKNFNGEIIKIIERGESRFVGQLRKDGKTWYVMPDGHTLHVPIMIGDPHAKSAQADDQVVVEITQYPDEGKRARGVIVERLGPQTAPGVDLLTIIHSYHLPTDFPEEVLDEARQVVREFNADTRGRERKDLSSQTIITIDPESARDFDDAISLEQQGDEVELGVHIADVASFVPPGSATDAEARKRGTSVYLPNRVIPMLPEVLSNGLCSLQENEPRFCKSAFIRYDRHGNVLDARFSNTVIRSTKRLTYREATGILEGKTSGYPKKVVTLVQAMEKLAKAIQQRRDEAGALALNLPEVELIMDDKGRVVDAQPEDTSFSHKIIEMFMVEANEAVARLLESLDVPFLRRIHPKPDFDAMQDLSRFVRATGHSIARKITPAAVQDLLETVKNKPASYAINLAVLKTLSSAEYSPEPIGHFALASEAYTHFTSPIRRYPDLTIHRLLDLYVKGELKPPRKRRKDPLPPPNMPDFETLEEEGRDLSCLERRADDAEKELKNLKVLTLLKKHQGEEFTGVVTGVTSFGLFVQHPKYLIDGLLRFEDLGDDWWEADVRNGKVIGRRSGRSLGLGSEIEVKIAAIDLTARTMALVSESKKKTGGQNSRRRGQTKRKSSGSKRRHKSNRRGKH